MKIMHDFFRDDRIVMNISTTNKSYLKVRDTLVEMSFKSLGQNLGDGFIGSIIKNYWPIVINSASFLLLGIRAMKVVLRALSMWLVL